MEDCGRIWRRINLGVVVIVPQLSRRRRDGERELQCVDNQVVVHLPDSQTDERAGTLGYMAPQQLVGEKYGYEVDLWGLG